MTAAARRVAALIINWNGSGDTLELLDSLSRQASETLYVEAFVVDNKSAPEDLEALEKGVASRGSFPIHLVRNDENVGVPAGYNRAIAAAGREFDYYLRLDNDVVLKDGCVGRLVRGLEEWRERDVRLVGCNVRYYVHPEESNGGAVTFDLVRGRTRTSYPEIETPCDGVLGCVMLLDREVVTAFAPEVFLGWLFYTTDESELSLHCAEKGWRTLYLPEPLALHKGGRSTQKVSEMATLTSIRNWAYLTIRYAKPRLRASWVLCRLLLISFPGQLSRGRWGRSLALLRGVAAAVGFGGPVRAQSTTSECDRRAR